MNLSMSIASSLAFMESSLYGLMMLQQPQGCQWWSWLKNPDSQILLTHEVKLETAAIWDFVMILSQTPNLWIQADYVHPLLPPNSWAGTGMQSFPSDVCRSRSGNGDHKDRQVNLTCATSLFAGLRLPSITPRHQSIASNVRSFTWCDTKVLMICQCNSSCTCNSTTSRSKRVSQIINFNYLQVATATSESGFLTDLPQDWCIPSVDESCNLNGALNNNVRLRSQEQCAK